MLHERIFHIFCMPFKFKIIVATCKIPKSRFFCQSSPTMQLLSGMTSRPRRAFWLIVFLRSTLRKETTIPGYIRDLCFISRYCQTKRRFQQGFTVKINLDSFFNAFRKFISICFPQRLSELE
jgi:hypothetical protein